MLVEGSVDAKLLQNQNWYNVLCALRGPDFELDESLVVPKEYDAAWQLTVTQIKNRYNCSSVSPSVVLKWLTRQGMFFSCRENDCSCWHVGLFSLERLS